LQETIGSDAADETPDPCRASRTRDHDRLISKSFRRTIAQRRHRVPAEEHVQRRHEDVQVLAVEDNHQEREHDSDVQEQPDALEGVERIVAQP